MADPTDTAAQPPNGAPDLAALYRAAVETGEAGELVRALCLVHGVSLRGLVELTGLAQSTVSRWKAGGRADERALRDLMPLLKPTKATQRGIAEVRSRRPVGQAGRPKLRNRS